jgi:acetyl-CoA/propionyl-CoA carboxylase, biotin carboxylase, biotin carboxyl carrier protein
VQSGRRSLHAIAPPCIPYSDGVFSKVLIANRGEIAVRIARTCRELGVATVGVYSDVDAHARHAEAVDEAVHLPGVAPAETYLNLDAVVDAARSTGAEAIHPGYGFFSERADAAEGIEAAGLVWIGPPPDATRAVGDKVRARQLADSAGVSVVPGTLRPIGRVEEVHAFGEAHGYPIAIKAAGGGGGRGLRVAGSPGEVGGAFESAVREAEAYFGHGDVYLERYLVRPKHIEIQVLAPAAGQAVWLGARDCSLQRRHQKLVEETPPPLWVEVVPSMGDAAVAVANACGYVNAGTVEFLVDEDGAFYFLEVNARLQVEHTITEEVLGIDLVAFQLRIAAGEPLPFDLAQMRARGRGHAIECRINAEDPARDFAPGPGRISAYREPAGPGIRVDSGYSVDDVVPGAYDSLLAKLIVSAPTREEARRRMLRALDEYVIEGVPTTISAHRLLLETPDFVDGSYTTRTVAGGALDALRPTDAADAAEEAVLLVGGQAVRLWHPAMAGQASGSTRAAGGGTGSVTAPLHGTVLKVLRAEGDDVAAGEPLVVIEAMKMETNVTAPRAGQVTAIHVKEGDVVESGEVLAEVSSSDAD